MNRWLGMLLSVTIAVLLLSPGRTPVSAEARAAVGYRAPDTQMLDLQEQPVSLASLQGQVVVLNFWATWCPPCRAEMPELQAFYTERSTGVALVGVNMTAGDVAPAQVRAFLAQRGYTYPVWLDTHGTAGDTYRVRTVPTTYFIDAAGVIRAKYLGPMTRADVRAGIRAAGGKL